MTTPTPSAPALAHLEYRSVTDLACMYPNLAEYLKGVEDQMHKACLSVGELAGKHEQALRALTAERAHTEALATALRDIEECCSLNGFPEDAPETIQFIGTVVAKAIAAHDARKDTNAKAKV